MTLNNAFGSWSTWKHIIKCSSDFWKIGYVDVGCGSQTSFWFDYWVRGEVECLSVKFPRIFAASSCNDALVSDIFCPADRSWNLQLLFQLRGGAKTELLSLLGLLEHAATLVSSSESKGVMWPLQRNNIFSVKSMYSTLAEHRFPGIQSFPTKLVWRKEVPSKIACFLWRCFYGKIASLDNLQLRGWSLANRCYLCESAEESVCHLLLHYNVTARVWYFFMNLLSIALPMTASLSEWMLVWSAVDCSKPSFAALLPHASFGRFGTRETVKFLRINSPPKPC
ncbi:Putative ribonuclease H protein At1g65750 [Linum grandiflorum]